MRKCLLLFILTSCSQAAFVQFTDDFFYGDFTNNLVCEGKPQNGAQLKTGIYIVFMQLFSEAGEVESYKKVVVLHN